MSRHKMDLKKTLRFLRMVSCLSFCCVMLNARAEFATSFPMALKRASYLLNGKMPTESEFNASQNTQSYRDLVRKYIDSPDLYEPLLRYHEVRFGTGLPEDYLDDLLRSEIDGKENKFAKISCSRTTTGNAQEGQVISRYRCYWSGNAKSQKIRECAPNLEQAVDIFWRPGVVAWVCPSVARACGAGLRYCFVEAENPDEAKNAELGTSEIFDSKVAVIKSLSRQSAGLATAVVMEGFPYTKILEPGLTAVDGAVAHFYGQKHHFDLSKVSAPASLISQIAGIQLTDTKFRLIYFGKDYQYGGLISTFAYLRRYEKNRTRANQLYERLLCRKFTAELPRVFPQDPGNLRTTPGCMGCHATLDPLADFFAAWGEGGGLYAGAGASKEGSFVGQSGLGLSKLVDIIRTDQAFSQCQVQHAWEWLMGRKFYKSEETLRNKLAEYFVNTRYNFKELLYAISTHPAFLVQERGDASVTDPLEAPALGTVPSVGFKAACKSNINYTTDIAPLVSQCSVCHRAGTTRKPLENETDWRQWGSLAVGMMASGTMPPGQTGPPISGTVYDLKELARCWLEQ